MLTFLIFLIHILLNTLLGAGIVSFFQDSKNENSYLLESFAIGFVLETILIFILLLSGLSLMVSFLIASGLALILGGLRFQKIKTFLPKFSFSDLKNLKIYEWILVALVIEKIGFAFWQLAKTPTYFDDALTHWSGRARALFGGINWSFDASVQEFLGSQFGNKEYPLGVIIRRATDATLNGSWNEFIARSDSFLFFILIIFGVGSIIYQFSKTRWMALAGAFVVSAIPLHFYHAAAGYVDIGVEAFAVLAIGALLRKEWILTGLLIAGTMWVKNDGLVLFFPAFLGGIALFQLFADNSWKEKIKSLAQYSFAAFVPVLPWIIFRSLHNVGISPIKSGFVWHSDAPSLFLQSVFNSPSSSIFWLFCTLFIIGTAPIWLKDKMGRSIAIIFILLLSAMFVLFSCTNAYVFLQNQTTIHRSIMQLAGIAIIVVFYAYFLMGFSKSKNTVID